MAENSINIEVPRILVRKIKGVVAGEAGLRNVLVEFDDGKMFLLEIPLSEGPRLFQAGLACLPPIPLKGAMSADAPVFDVQEYAIGNDPGGELVLVADFTGSGQVGMRMTPASARSLRDLLDTLLASLDPTTFGKSAH